MLIKIMSIMCLFHEDCFGDTMWFSLPITFLNIIILLACYSIGLSTECISDKKKTKVPKVELAGPMQQTINSFHLRYMVICIYCF